MGKLRVEKRGRYWQYRFEATKICGKRKQISKSGYKSKSWRKRPVFQLWLNIKKQSYVFRYQK